MYQNKVFTDQMGRQITLVQAPKRIISLVPSQTELLHYLGLEEQVVGITKFCEHPEQWYRQKTRVGGTKKFDFDKIKALQPDLIIGNKEENEKKQMEELSQDYHLWMSDIKNLDDANAMIEAIGQITQTSLKAAQLIADINTSFHKLEQQRAGQKALSAAYLIWQNPYMVAAKDTFIDHLLTQAGFSNSFANQQRYPSLTKTELQNSQPDCLLLSSEPFPFREKHLAELQEICPQSVIKLVDGTLFSWYGNRLLLSASYFLNLHTEISNEISKRKHS